MADQQNTGEVQGGVANLTNAGKGRKKGVPNKTTASAKAVIEQAAEALGGGKRLVEWAQEDEANEREFWARIYPRLIPLSVTGNLKIDLGEVITSARARLNG